MDRAFMCDARFLDNRTIQLIEDYPVPIEEIRLIIIPKKQTNKKRIAGILKGKISMTDDFNEPLEEMMEYTL